MKKEMSEFMREYFLQTRREIDTEKSSRDSILNFAILTIGAIGFGMFQNDKVDIFLQQPIFLILEMSMLASITTLFWLRSKKLHQIADRWFVLHSILREHQDEMALDKSLEGIVVLYLQTTRYPKKDVVVCLGLSSPIYSLMLVNLWNLMPIPSAVVVLILIFVMHLVIAWRLMISPCKPPNHLVTTGEMNQNNKQVNPVDRQAPTVD